MARINIEESIWKDFRFLELVKKSNSTDEAIGSLVRCWSVAQRYWYPNKQPIPKDVWDREQLSNALIDCGLAYVEQCSIYVRGCSTQFQWIFDKSEAGKKSAEARKKKTGSSQPKKPEQPRTAPNT